MMQRMYHGFPQIANFITIFMIKMIGMIYEFKGFPNSERIVAR